MNEFLFGSYPYICLTIFTLGLLCRYIATPGDYPMDIVVILLIMWQACTGGYQDYAGNYDAFATVAPWIRGILVWEPHPELMTNVPVYLKVHVCVGFLIFACIPFSRLMHFISFPFTWFLQPIISYRRRYENL